jgi:hypothetical protein
MVGLYHRWVELAEIGRAKVAGAGRICVVQGMVTPHSPQNIPSSITQR